MLLNFQILYSVVLFFIFVLFETVVMFFNCITFPLIQTSKNLLTFSKQYLSYSSLTIYYFIEKISNSTLIRHYVSKVYIKWHCKYKLDQTWNSNMILKFVGWPDHRSFTIYIHTQNLKKWNVKVWYGSFCWPNYTTHWWQH